MFAREVQEDAMTGVAQEAFARCHGPEDAPIAVDTKVDREARGVSSVPVELRALNLETAVSRHERCARSCLE